MKIIKLKLNEGIVYIPYSSITEFIISESKSKIFICINSKIFTVPYVKDIELILDEFLTNPEKFILSIQ